MEVWMVSVPELRAMLSVSETFISPVNMAVSPAFGTPAGVPLAGVQLSALFQTALPDVAPFQV